MAVALNIRGWSTCGSYQKAKGVLSALSALYPSEYTVNVVEDASRPPYKAWLMGKEWENGGGPDGFRTTLGDSRSHKHVSSPFVWTDDGKFIGGGDDTLAWARKVLGAPGAADAVSANAIDGHVKDHEYDYDLVVIGGGSGGLACSKEAAKHGAKVAVLDFVKPSPLGTKWGLGGTCVNVGCIPKKLMHNAALIGETIKADAAAYGWGDAAPKHDWVAMKSNVQDHIKGLNFKYRVSLRDAGVTYHNKLGKFVDPHTLECTDKKGKVSTITASRFVIAVGGRPSPLACPGAEHAISSDDLFSLEAAPGRTCVVGAGYVALECGGFLTALGHDVTVLVRSILLRGFDRECCDKIGEHMEAHGTKLMKGVTPTNIEKQADGTLKVTYSDGESGVYDTVIGAVGRTADTKSLNIEAALGATPEKNGKLVCVDEQLPSCPNVYAIGDVLQNKPELTPVAIQAGVLLARRLFDGKTEPMDYGHVATAVFTPLEYGVIGLSEEEATEKAGCNLEVYHSSFVPLEWSVSEERHDTTGFAKILVDKGAGEKILGIHYLGPHAGEVTQGFATAFRAAKGNLTWQDFESTVGIHPTSAEELVTLKVTKSSGEDAAAGGC